MVFPGWDQASEWGCFTQRQGRQARTKMWRRILKKKTPKHFTHQIKPWRKIDNIFSESDPGKMSPPVQMPLLPPGLQQMQQLLQANIANILFQANIKENVLFQANVQIYQELTLTNRTLFKITQSNMLTNYFKLL